MGRLLPDDALSIERRPIRYREMVLTAPRSKPPITYRRLQNSPTSSIPPPGSSPDETALHKHFLPQQLTDKSIRTRSHRPLHQPKLVHKNRSAQNSRTNCRVFRQTADASAADECYSSQLAAPPDHHQTDGHALSEAPALANGQTHPTLQRAFAFPHKHQVTAPRRQLFRKLDPPDLHQTRPACN